MKVFSLLFTVLFFTAICTNAQTVYPEGLKAGDKAPLFSATTADGNAFDLSAELKKGAVVVVFYRGYWCPFCNRQLSKLNDSLQLIVAKGASVVAVTAETDEGITKTVEKTHIAFPVIEDKGLAIMKSYKVNFAVDENTVAKYKGYGIDFNKTNGDNGTNLPVPATYIIGKDGKIIYAFFNTDYRQRASVKDILDKL